MTISQIALWAIFALVAIVLVLDLWLFIDGGSGTTISAAFDDLSSRHPRAANGAALLIGVLIGHLFT